MTNSSPTDHIREALEPFAKRADGFESFDGQHDFPDDHVVLEGFGSVLPALTVGDFRRARAAISSMPTIAGDEERARLVDDVARIVDPPAFRTYTFLRHMPDEARARDVALQKAENIITRALQTLSPEHIRRGIDE